MQLGEVCSVPQCGKWKIMLLSSPRYLSYGLGCMQKDRCICLKKGPKCAMFLFLFCMDEQGISIAALDRVPCSCFAWMYQVQGLLHWIVCYVHVHVLHGCTECKGHSTGSCALFMLYMDVSGASIAALVHVPCSCPCFA